MADVHRLSLNTQRFLHGLKNERKAMSRKLKADLKDFTDNLHDDMDDFRHECHKEQKELHHEFKEGHNAFQRFGKTMAAKRRNFFGTVNAKFKQEMKHTPRTKH